MNKLFKYLAIFAGAIISFCACTDESELSNSVDVEEGKEVTLSLNYNVIDPSVIIARSDATSEENKLTNLYVYIFSSDGKLKGFSKIEDSSQLNQEGKEGNVTVLTTTGESYIYAVANYKKKNTVYTINDLPTDIDPEDAQAGRVTSFNMDNFKSLKFTRASGEILISEYLMCGTVNEGKECIIESINGAGFITTPTAPNDQLIKLDRIVSKVQFNIKAGDGVEFIPQKYEIINIPVNGSIIKGQQVQNNTFDSYSDVFSTQSRNFFEVKLPENLQTMKKSVKSWHDREANTYSGDKITFTNAPDNGTYVVLYGKFRDTANKIEGDTHYYIHLGDCGRDVDDYNNERNCKYIYNVTVKNVNEIIVEAKKDVSHQPGAEGFVIDYKAGKSFILDSHYEYCVLRFCYEDIRKIKDDSNNQRGYVYQVKALGRETDIINVANAQDTLNAQLNGVDISWIKFAKGGTYDERSDHGGRQKSYTETKEETYGNNKQGELLTINALLLYLYDIATKEEIDKWTKIDEKHYITFTGYVDENYYENLSWDKYTNIEPRVIYIADEVWSSTDNKSIYAKVAYSVSQYAIQTFYDRNHSSTLIAYGCETINDEKGQQVTQNNNKKDTGNMERNDNKDALDGRLNMKSDFAWSSTMQWNVVNNGTSIDLREACMSRNRDLNRNGVIDDDEIRWYTPTVAQYTGLWIGEEALANTDARLFTNKMADISSTQDPDIMHYYTSTNGARTYWAEEGMAYGTQTGKEGCKYIRCVRTLKSNDIGYAETPSEYYTIESDNKIISLQGLVDATALRSGTILEGELPPHKERTNEASPYAFNRPREKFLLAERRAGEVWKMNDHDYSWDWSGSATTFNLKPLLTGTPCGTYGQEGQVDGTLADRGKWRAPNQREFCLIELKGEARTFDATRTGYTGTYRFGYHKNNEVNMISNQNINNLTVRCVRDYSEGLSTVPTYPEVTTKVRKGLTFKYQYKTDEIKNITGNLKVTGINSNIKVSTSYSYRNKWTVTIMYSNTVDLSDTNLTFTFSYDKRTYLLTVNAEDFINDDFTEYILRKK